MRTKRPHIPDEAAPGTAVEVGGWIIDGNSEPVRAAWIDIGGVSFPVDLNRERSDVALAHRMTDRAGKRVGFSAIIHLPADLGAGVHEVRVVGASASGIGVYGSGVRRIRIAYPPIEAVSISGAASTRNGTIRVGDTHTASYTLGRGRQTIRDESSLRLIGRIDGAKRVHVTAAPLAGAPVAWEFPVDAAGGFDAVLWTADLPQGLHRLSIASGDATSLDPTFWCEIALAGPHRLPPLHLGVLRSVPDAGVIHFAGAAPRTTPVPDDGLVAGTPIGVAGWCMDPVAGMPVLAVYVAVDDQRPVPLSAYLPDPRRFGVAGEPECGFGGIIDTTRLEPGSHRVRLLGAAVSGSGWFVIDDRNIQLADHRLSTLAGGARN